MTSFSDVERGRQVVRHEGLVLALVAGRYSQVVLEKTEFGTRLLEGSDFTCGSLFQSPGY